ncbi:hypothetical protein JVT61DRAFT_9111 [Boletus reticuloceps]|uniref:Uncharacterized protein n=1 Tax=Boletus reticuloceps TaxID=495285 RepID=A0A8I2YGW4_9AGAM|nr:hypothetical protein JVT61DRAFT_9111 [Boletus reticuloceps]
MSKAFLLQTMWVETPRYHPSCITTSKVSLARWVARPSRRASLREQKMKNGLRWNGEKPRLFTCRSLSTEVRDTRWKLHLRPKNLASNHVTDQDLPLLPMNRSAIQILSDFMGYLFRCSKTYIQESHVSGPEMWGSFENNIDFVLSHLNGWEGPQQTQIQRAAVLAGLVPDSPEGQARIQLVTEGELCMHFCLSTEKTAGSFKEDQGIMIIDAGGGTIDVSSYYMTTSPPTFQEIAPVECKQEFESGYLY